MTRLLFATAASLTAEAAFALFLFGEHGRTLGDVTALAIVLAALAWLWPLIDDVDAPAGRVRLGPPDGLPHLLGFTDRAILFETPHGVELVLPVDGDWTLDDAMEFCVEIDELPEAVA